MIVFIYSFGKVHFFISLGDIVEVERDQNANTATNNSSGDDSSFTDFFAILFRHTLAFAISIRIAYTSGNQDTLEDDEGRVDEELDSHPLNEFFSVVLIVLLQPLEPFE